MGGPHEPFETRAAGVLHPATVRPGRRLRASEPMGQAGGPQAADPAGRSAAAQLTAQPRNGRRHADAPHHRAAAKSEPVPDGAGPGHKADDSVTLAELAGTRTCETSLQEESREDHGMERFIADLVKIFESGKVDRREFCKTVALAATVYAAGDAANAQAPRGFKIIGVNHLSYTCPDYAQVRDWYVSVLGMESTP